MLSASSVNLPMDAISTDDRVSPCSCCFDRVYTLGEDEYLNHSTSLYVPALCLKSRHKDLAMLILMDDNGIRFLHVSPPL
jgi:hypothetical protein